jgi:hypothetical protein
MKNLSIIFALFLSCTIHAQTQPKGESSVHLAFKGVPIDGTLNEYVLKMKKNGFTHIGTEDGVAMLTGDFASYKNCVVGVVTLKQKDLVSKITVLFPKCDTWSSLSSNYFSLKEMLTKKYGKPTDCVEKFQTYSQPEDDNNRMHEVRMDRCKYYAVYATEKGSIELSIEQSSGITCCVRLSYFDKINGDIIAEEAMKDL